MMDFLQDSATISRVALSWAVSSPATHVRPREAQRGEVRASFLGEAARSVGECFGLCHFLVFQINPSIPTGASGGSRQWHERTLRVQLRSDSGGAAMSKVS